MKTHPHPISAADVPEGVRFDVPRRNQGQTIEVAYGTTDRGEACYRDPFARVTDRALPPGHPDRVTYWRRA